MPYSKTIWQNGTVPAINSTNLNNIETGIADAHNKVVSVDDYSDGVSDTTAIRNAIASLSAGGILHFGPRTYSVDEAAATEVFLITKSIIIQGSGEHSTIEVASTVPATTDVIRFFPDAGEESFFSVRDLRIVPASGTPARHGIALDASVNGMMVRHASIEGCTINRFGGFSVATINGTGAAPTNTTAPGIFACDIRRNRILGGIGLIGAADSISIERNVIAGTGRAIEADLIDGAAVLDIRGNNITATGGVLINAAHHVFLTDNYLEMLVGSTPAVSNSALLDLNGATRQLIHPVVANNTIGAHVAGISCVRVANCVSATIRDNDTSSQSGTFAVVIVSPASGTHYGRNHNYGAGGPVSNAGDGTATYETQAYLAGAPSAAKDGTIWQSGYVRSSSGLITKHEAANVPTGGISGEIRVGNGKIWINDAGIWRSVAIA